MSIPNVARQYPLSVFLDIDFNDIVVHATAYTLCELPQGSVIIRGAVYVVTAFVDNGVFDTNFGDVTDPNRYSQTIVEIDATGSPTNDFTPDGYKTTASEPALTTTAVFGTTTDTPSAGAFRLVFEYVTSGRNNENLG